MKIQLSTSGQITYFVELTKVESGYKVAYLAEGSTQKMCPVNQQFCDSDCHETCCHYDNGCVLPVYSKEECESLYNVIITGDDSFTYNPKQDESYL
jgi:hypothetical protein